MAERVLLVDDETDFLEIMSERLSARGMEVVTATSTEEALIKLEQDVFDAIILDFQMPGLDGFAALKAIKAKKPESQVILLTGFATIEKGVEAMRMGAFDFLEKPTDLEALADKVKLAKAEKMLIVEKQIEGKIKDVLKKYGV